MKAATASSIGAALYTCATETLAGRRSYWSGPGAVSREIIAQDRRTEPSIHLTPRQLEVLALLCEGLPNKLICRRLNIATGTVKVHISCILRELGVTSRLQALVAARNLGLPGEVVAGTPEQLGGVAPAGAAVNLVPSRKSGASNRLTAAA